MITEQKNRIYLKIIFLVIAYLAVGFFSLGAQNNGWAQENDDQEEPTLAPQINETLLWPPDDRMVDIIIETNVWDNSGTTTFSVEVTSNEPEEDQEDDDTSIDWTDPVIEEETGVITLQLRAERSEEGNGRVYTIAITATDPSNNSKTVFSNIFVPYEIEELKTQADNTDTTSRVTIAQTSVQQDYYKILSDLEMAIKRNQDDRLALAHQAQEAIGNPELLLALHKQDMELKKELRRLRMEYSALKAKLERR